MFVLSASPALLRRAAFRPVFRSSWSRAVEHDAPRASDTQVPAMDVVETDTGYTLAFDMPGAVKDQVQVSVEGRRVFVEAAPPAPAQGEGARVVYRERSAPRYARTVALPLELDGAATRATFADGVLTLAVAKKAVAGPTKIAVA